MEAIARDVVDALIPAVELIGAVVIGVGAMTAFGAYGLSELRLRPRPNEGIQRARRILDGERVHAGTPATDGARRAGGPLRA